METDKKECGCDVHDYCSQHTPKENTGSHQCAPQTPDREVIAQMLDRVLETCDEKTKRE